MKKESNKNEQKYIKTKLLTIFLRLFIIIMFIFIFKLLKLNLLQALIFVIILYIIILTVINIHEFGHLIFGKLFGYKLLRYSVGIFSWNNVNSKMKFSIKMNIGYGGLCGMIPPDKDIKIFKIGLFYAGGIIFNILFGIILLSIIHYSTNLSSAISLLLNFTGIVSIVSGFLNFIPITSSNNPSDGLLLWSIILKKPIAKKYMAISNIIAKLSSGIRPRDLQMSNLDTDNSDRYYFMSYIYSYFIALDNNDINSMIHYSNIMKNNIQSTPTLQLTPLYYELCYLGCILNDIDEAKKFYKKAGNNLQKDNDINGLRIKAYYEYYINKNPESALKYCLKALEVANKFPIKGQALMEKDLINVLIEMIRTDKML